MAHGEGASDICAEESLHELEKGCNSKKGTIVFRRIDRSQVGHESCVGNLALPYVVESLILFSQNHHNFTDRSNGLVTFPSVSTNRAH